MASPYATTASVAAGVAALAPAVAGAALDEEELLDRCRDLVYSNGSPKTIRWFAAVCSDTALPPMGWPVPAKVAAKDGAAVVAGKLLHTIAAVRRTEAQEQMAQVLLVFAWSQVKKEENAAVIYLTYGAWVTTCIKIVAASSALSKTPMHLEALCSDEKVLGMIVWLAAGNPTIEQVGTVQAQLCGASAALLAAISGHALFQIYAGNHPEVLERVVGLLLSVQPSEVGQKAVVQQCAALALSRLARLPQHHGRLGPQPGLMKKLIDMLAPDARKLSRKHTAKSNEAAVAGSRLAGTILSVLSVEEQNQILISTEPGAVGTLVGLCGSADPSIQRAATCILANVASAPAAQSNLMAEPSIVPTLFDHLNIEDLSVCRCAPPACPPLSSPTMCFATRSAPGPVCVRPRVLG